MDERQEQNLELLHGVNGFRESQRDMAEMQTADSSETDPRLSDLLKENAELKRTVETLNMQLHISKEELRVFGVEQVMWREQEALLKDKVSHYEKLVRADQGERVWRESERSERVPEETVHLQKAALSLQQVLKRTKQEIERETFKARETELQAQIQLLESQITELRETVDKPCTTESETIDGRKDIEEEFKRLVQSLENAELNFNKERAEWRKLRQELEDRATASELQLVQREKLLEKVCEERSLEKQKGLRERQDEEQIVQSQEETVSKEGSTQNSSFKDLLRKWETASTPESAAATKQLQSNKDLKEELNQKDKTPDDSGLITNLLQGQRLDCGQRALEEPCGRWSGVESGRRAVEAEAKLRNDPEERDMLVEILKRLCDLQKDHEDLKTSVGNLKGAEETEPSRASEALVSDLRLQHDITLWAKHLTEQQETLERQKEQWVKTETELREENTRIEALLQDEREKTARLQKKAQEKAQNTEYWKQAVRIEMKHVRTAREEALDAVTELKEAKKQLETELKETKEQHETEEIEIREQLETELEETKKRLETKLEETKKRHETELTKREQEQLLKDKQWREAEEEFLEAIHFLHITIKSCKTQKKRKGFFHRVFCHQ